MLRTKNFRIGYKLCFGLLGFSAIVTEIATTTARGTFRPANFFSYFTIETNILVAAVLILSAIATARGKNEKLALWRGVATLAILVVGLGFSLLLAGLENTEFTAVPWDNMVLHYIMPVAVLLDWLIDRPKRQILLGQALLWLLFPLAYVVYSLVRGPIVGWYPYPFLDPGHSGYPKVLAVVTGLMILSLILAWAVAKLSGKKHFSR